MKNNKIATSVVLTLGLMILSPVFAGAQNQTTTTSTDSDSQAQSSSPSQEGGQRRERFRQRMQERREERHDEWKQIEGTFTPDQQQKIGAIRAQTKKLVEPLRQQMQSLRQQMDANSSGQNNDSLRSQMRDLHQQIHAAMRDRA